MKTRILLSLLLLPLLIGAQQSRFHIDLVATHNIGIDDRSGFFLTAENEFVILDMDDFISTSLQAFYSINEYVELGAGVTYAKVDVRALVNCEFCLTFLDSIVPIVQRKQELIQFPFLFNFYPLTNKKKFTPFISGAFIPTKIRKPPLGSDYSGKFINFQLGTGFQFRLFNWLKWGLEANLAYQTIRVEEVESYSRYVGLGSRMSIYF